MFKLCSFICKTSDDVDKLVSHLDDEEVREALLSQIRYYKSVNRGAVKGSLFFVTTGGKPLNTNELCQRLKSILQQLSSHHDDNTDHERSSTTSTSNLEINRSQLKEKLLAKLKPNATGIKHKNPVRENVVNKKIKHTCLTPCGKHLKVYTGKVLRMSTDKDIEELLEEYKSYIDKDYTFLHDHI